MARHSLRLALSLVLGILITVGGCSESPSDASRLEQLEASYAKGSTVVESSVAQLIGEDGGTIVIPGGHSLTFPEGALREATLITARPDLVFLSIDFGPHGLTFPADRAPTLTLSYENAKNYIGTVSIAYLNEAGQITEVLPTTDDKAAKKVKADIAHFSRYAIATGH